MRLIERTAWIIAICALAGATARLVVDVRRAERQRDTAVWRLHLVSNQLARQRQITLRWYAEAVNARRWRQPILPPLRGTQVTIWPSTQSNGAERFQVPDAP